MMNPFGCSTIHKISCYPSPAIRRSFFQGAQKCGSARVGDTLALSEKRTPDRRLGYPGILLHAQRFIRTDNQPEGEGGVHLLHNIP